VTNSLADQLARLKSDLNRLPEAKQPPSTTLQIIRNNQQEEEWQQLLFHYLSQDEPHGLDHAFLEHILSALSDRDDLDFTFSGLDLADVQVRQEVTIPNGRRPDAVVWASEEWFICWELKIKASEREDQTQDYGDAESFENINLTKKDVPDSGQHYVYLAPKDASPPEAEEFVHVWWRWVAEQIQTFLNEGHGGYPSRTTAQLEQFIGTIQNEVTMTDYQENQQEKAELYFEYYDAITEAQEAYEDRWDWFANNWGSQLAETMDSVEPVEMPSLRDTDIAVELTQPSIQDETWVFSHTDSDWATFFKEGWFRHKDDLSNIYTPDENRDDIWVMFCHRLEKNREKAIKENLLQIRLIYGLGNNKQFNDEFREKFINKIESSNSGMPSSVSIPGIRSSPLSATYDIPVHEHNNFFEGYVAALDDAFHDLVIENREVITLIDEAYEESLSVFD
jgi:hypothetical protein